jgi:uncharacterized repeat protein (TIGR03803 family)
MEKPCYHARQIQGASIRSGDLGADLLERKSMRAIRRLVLFLLPAINSVILECRFRGFFRTHTDKPVGPRWLGRTDTYEKFNPSKMVWIVLMVCVAMAVASPAQMFRTLASFNETDGASPRSSLVQGTDGNFYGTTHSGGHTVYCADDCGTVFEITPNGALTSLYTFCSQNFCTDGSSPNGLVQATDGNFYGTTEFGGANGAGTVFKITPGGMLTTLYSFCPQTNCPDGDGPQAGLVQGTDGNFYGTTFNGGYTGDNCGTYFGCGTVFKITPSGTLTTLHSFCTQVRCPDGENPWAGLVQASDGNFYGTTSAGGAGTYGSVFKITPSGTLTTLHSFNDNDGSAPLAALVQTTDGNLYGTTYFGGNCLGSCGTVFKITPSGTFSTLHTFCPQSGCTDGQNPEGALVQATDGNLYGTTQGGGPTQFCGGGCGTVFEITASGTLTTLYIFCSQSNCADGSYPSAGLVQATDGNFYGTTSTGGANGAPEGDGTVFRLSGPSATAVQFVPVTPCRLADTRPDHGGSGPIQGRTFQIFNLQQLAQTKGCADLSSATAYSLNIAVVPQRTLAYLTLWPTGGSRPGVATLNSLDGRIKANAAIVRAGSAGAVSVYATHTTDVVIDIDGYFAPVSSSTLAFYPMTPCRIADTRKSTFPAGLGMPFLSGQTPRDFPVLSSTCNIPSTAQAYSLNLSAVPYPSLGHPLGYLEVWPKDQMPANPVSTLNNLTGTVVANAAIVPAGTGGEITVYPSNNTDLVIDINGYFAPAGPGGLSLYPAAPCRVIDTRQIGSGQPFSGLLSPPVDVADSACAPPSTAQAYVFNATVVPFGGLGYLTLWQNDPMHQPVVSTLNALDGAITNNMAVVPTADGKINAFASGTTQLILDLSSYFAP